MKLMAIICLIAGIIITVVFRNYPNFNNEKTCEEHYKEMNK